MEQPLSDAAGDSLVRGLIEAVATAFALLEHSSDDELDPHVAVRGMENMTGCLQDMTPAAQELFMRYVDSIAAATEDGPWKQFLREMPYASGFVEEPPAPE